MRQVYNKGMAHKFVIIFMLFFISTVSYGQFGECIGGDGNISGSTSPTVGSTYTYNWYTYGEQCNDFDWFVTGGGASIIGANQNSITIKWNSTGSFWIEYYNGLSFEAGGFLSGTVQPGCPTLYTVSGGGLYCTGSAITKTVTLSDSESGVSYQLIRDGSTNIGSSKSGTGSSLSWTGLTDAGTYTVKGTGSGCTRTMNGSATVTVSVSPIVDAGPDMTVCSGDGIIDLMEVGGQTPSTGGFWFGTNVTSNRYFDASQGQSATLTYSVWDDCGDEIADTKYITVNPTPLSYNLYSTSNCVLDSLGGVTIYMDSSQINVSYQLLLDSVVVDSLAGSGTSLSWPGTSVSGTYSVKATAQEGCTVSMNNTVYVNPYTSNGSVLDCEEYAALKSLWESTGGATWTNNTGWPTAGNWPEHVTADVFGAWQGVTVVNGDVTKIILPNNNLSGTLPEELGDLTELTQIQLQSNGGLTGSLPQSLGNLSNLTYLYLFSNSLSGQIPDIFTGMTSLLYLRLDNNDFTGILPSSIGSLGGLKWLLVQNNPFDSASVPGFISNLSSLQRLYLSNTNLTGSIPETLSSLPLIYLLLNNNNLSGEVPASIWGIPTLQYLYLYSNNLSGHIDGSIASSNMRNLLINNNDFTGEIPPELWQRPLLYYVNIRYNNFTGYLPTDSTSSNLRYLYLNDNNIKGSVSSAFLSSPALTHVHLHNNDIKSIPDLKTHPKASVLNLKVEGNNLPFDKIEQNFTTSGVHPYASFTFSTQNVDQELCTVYFSPEDTVRLVSDAGGEYTTYQWKKDGIDLPGGTESVLLLPSLNEADTGSYHWVATNSFVDPSLTMQVTGQAITLKLMANDPDATSTELTLTNNRPATGTYIDDINYVRTYTSRVKITNEAQIGFSSPTDSVAISTQYFDGLGRPIQTTAHKASPLGADIVVPMEYDSYGRQAKQFLPFVDSVNATGLNSVGYRSNAIQDQYDYYHDDLQLTGLPYSEVLFEASPLNRPLEQAAPGERWNPGGNWIGHVAKTIEMDRWPNSNTKDGEVFFWEIVTEGIQRTAPYGDGQLIVESTTDEAGNEVRQYTNKLGQTVLKRVEQKDECNNTWLDTYYVYDDFGNLRYVLPPELIKTIIDDGLYTLLDPIDTNYDENGTLMARFAFQYNYDGRRRMISKKVPGADWVYMVYDNRDRLVLTQDGNQREDGEWLFTKYDQLNRPVVTGIMDTVSGREEIQGAVNDYYSTQDPIWGETFAGNTEHYGYTNNSYPITPDTTDYLTITYYDDYGFKTDWASASNYDFVPLLDNTEYFDRLKGLVTGSMTRVLDNLTDSLNWIKTVSYYDNRYRVIQTVSDNVQGGTDRVTNKYDFSGKVTNTQTDHSGSETLAVKRDFYYDHSDRLLNVWHQIDDNNRVLLLENQYDELGQLVEKNLHSLDSSYFSQSVDYDYNVRGWLTSINQAQQQTESNNNVMYDDLFGMELYYDHGFEKNQYNGNIAGVKWWGASTENSKAYGYEYDGLNRIRYGDYSEGLNWTENKDRYNMQVGGYDQNGNIMNLFRNGADEGSGINGVIDDLSYSYTGNRLQKVSDRVSGGLEDIGFKDSSVGTDYTYDRNGNLKADANKDISTITYNHLNLPDTVRKSTGEYIKYLYDAAGIKLSQIVHDAAGTKVKESDYVGEFIYENDTLQFIQTEEGRILKDTTGNYEYQYHLKDHLGNVRLTFTSVTDSTEYFTDFEATTNPEFENYSRINFDLMDHTDAGTVYTGAQMINGGTLNQIGVAKSLEVMPGDTVYAEIYGRYYTPGSTITDPSTLAGQIASAFSGSPYFTTEAGDVVDAFYGGGAAIGATGTYPWDDDLAPKVYLNVLVFDKNYQLQDFAYDQIDYGYEQAEGSIVKGPHNKMFREVVIKEEGYVYIYVSNENPILVDAWFDDFTVKHKKSPIVQSDDYYPFGLSFNSWKRSGSLKNKLNTFQDQELIDDLDLDWVQFKWRNHMPEIGRFFNIDPLAEKYVYNSPYAFAENRVIDGRELEGLEWVNSTGQKIYDPSLNDGKGGYTEHASNNDKTIGAALNRTEAGQKQFGKLVNSNHPIEIQLNESTEAVYIDQGKGKVEAGKTDNEIETLMDFSTSPFSKKTEVKKSTITINLGSIDALSNSENSTMSRVKLKGLSWSAIFGAVLGHEVQHTTEENVQIEANQGENAAEDDADKVSQDILEEEKKNNN